MKTSDGSIHFKKTFCLLGMCVLGCFAAGGVHAQSTSPNTIPGAATSAQAPLFSEAELDQMLAPVALYPDVLLTQTLIAATYPSEAIAAGNWLKANPDLRGKEAVEAASQTNWDDSIKSLAAFPEILVPMAEYPDWTTGLGNAFLSQQTQLMNRVQFLRQKAKEQGNLKTNEQVRIQTTGQATNQTIVIEPATTQTVYVPYYNPAIVYGNWWWPAYRPVYWNPWPYAGYATGYSSGFMWSGVGLWFSYTSYRPVYDWHYRRVYVDRYHHNYGSHNRPMPRREWNHRPEHRYDVSYRDKTYRQGLHGKPDTKPHGVTGNRPQGAYNRHDIQGRNDRPSYHKDNRPGSYGMGVTDNRYDKNQSGSLKGKPTNIPRKDNTAINHQRPDRGQGNLAGTGISSSRPVSSLQGKEVSGKQSSVRPDANGVSGRPQTGYLGSNQKTDHSVNHQPVQSRPSQRPGSNRPMSIPPVNGTMNGTSVNRPVNHRPAESPSMNRPASSQTTQGTTAGRTPSTRPALPPSMNRPAASQSQQSSPVSRPATHQPSQRQEGNRPSGMPASPGQSANRPAINRTMPAQSVKRPDENRRMPGTQGHRSEYAANRSAMSTRSVSRPDVSRRPSSSSVENRPSPAYAAQARPSAGSRHDAPAPSRSSSERESKPSRSDRGNNDQGRGR